MKAKPIDNPSSVPDMPGVPLHKIKKVIEIYENRMMKNGIDSTESEVPFEYLIGSLYPKIYHNMMETINKKYGEGYTQGREDMKNEIEGNA